MRKVRGRPKEKGMELSSSQYIAAKERFRRFLKNNLSQFDVVIKTFRGQLVIHSGKPWMTQLMGAHFGNSSAYTHFGMPKIPIQIEMALSDLGIDFELNDINTCVRIPVDQAACPQPMRRRNS